MDPAAVVKASEQIISANPLLGSLLVIAMAVIASLFWLLMKAHTREIECKAEHLKDAKDFSTQGEGWKHIIAANTEAMKNVLEALRDRQGGR